MTRVERGRWVMTRVERRRVIVEKEVGDDKSREKDSGCREGGG